MPFLYPTFLLFSLLLFAGAASAASSEEYNFWPFFTGKQDTERNEFREWQGLGPFLFEKETEDYDVIAGLRPFYIEFEEEEQNRRSRHLLYPLFNHRETRRGTSWDILSLARFDGSPADDDRDAHTRFVLFPVVHFQNHPDPDRDYFGIFPIAGEAQNFFGYRRVRWFTFPFSVRLERNEVTTVGMPWPFIRFVQGEGASGFHLWPLYGREQREGSFSRQYFLWPLGYEVFGDLHEEHPSEAHGFIPFYAYSRSEDAVSRTYVWPFFGYTTGFSPEYNEVRYFWPLFVQRRGEEHYTNRMAPFYTHSIRAGTEKQWVMWPLFRRERWEERGLVHNKSQMLFFLYWSLEQSRPGQPEAGTARKQHVWPFISLWDDGAGRRQVQLLSPFEVFFPYNEVVRENWSPLFAIYRYDRRPDRSRHSFLFDFITLARDDESTHLDVGPLAGYKRAEEGRRFELGRGLLTLGAHAEGKRPFRLFWLPREGQENNENE